MVWPAFKFLAQANTSAGVQEVLAASDICSSSHLVSGSWKTVCSRNKWGGGLGSHMVHPTLTWMTHKHTSFCGITYLLSFYVSMEFWSEESPWWPLTPEEAPFLGKFLPQLLLYWSNLSCSLQEYQLCPQLLWTDCVTDASQTVRVFLLDLWPTPDYPPFLCVCVTLVRE